MKSQAYDSLLGDYQKRLLSIREETELYIRGHYGKLPRSKLAKRVGIPKYDLNMLLIKMGLGG